MNIAYLNIANLRMCIYNINGLGVILVHLYRREWWQIERSTGKANVEALLYFEENEWHLCWCLNGRLDIFKYRTLTEGLVCWLNNITQKTADENVVNTFTGWDAKDFNTSDLERLVEEIFNSESECHKKGFSSKGIFEYLVAHDPALYVAPQVECYIDKSSIFKAALIAGIDSTAIIEKYKKDQCLGKKIAVDYGWLDIVTQLHLQEQHVSYQYKFTSISQLVFWAIDQVKDNQHIKRCEVCGKYYSPKRSTAKYCSSVCRNKHSNENLYLAEKEIKNLYNKNYTLIRSKLDIGKKRGLPYKSKSQPEENPKEESKEDQEEYFDLKEIREDFFKVNNDFRIKLYKVHDDAENDPCIEKIQEYNRIKGEYISWLTERHAFLKSLRLDLDYHLDY